MVFICSCEHKIECFTVSTAPVRSEIELHNNRYWDVLSISLYASVMVDVNAIEEFVADSKKRLEYQPQSLDEIGNASEAYRQIVDKSKEVSLAGNTEQKRRLGIIIEACVLDRENNRGN